MNIILDNIDMTYSTKPKLKKNNVFKELSYSFKENEISAVLGKNGSGKSTLIKIISGIIAPNKGSVLINGLDPFKNKKNIKRNIGVFLGSKHDLWWDLPLFDSLLFTKSIYKLSKKEFNKSISEYSEILDIADLLKVPVRTMSLGQRTKSTILQSILHSPAIALLDEPTIGLDFSSVEKLIELILLLQKEKKSTILISSHDLLFLQKLAPQLAIIANKNIAATTSIQNIIKEAKVLSIISGVYNSPTYMDNLKQNFTENEEIIINPDSTFKILLKKESKSIENILSRIIKAEREGHIKSFKFDNYDLSSILVNLYG